MSEFKDHYRDENDLINDYCKSVDCNACHGTDMNGEPNGYGCHDMEKFMEENEEKLVLYDDDLVEFLDGKIEKLQNELEKVKKERDELKERVELLEGFVHAMNGVVLQASDKVSFVKRLLNENKINQGDYEK